MLYKALLLSKQEREDVNRRLGAMTMRAVRDFYESVYLVTSERQPGGACSKEHPEACSRAEADSVRVEEIGDHGQMKSTVPAIRWAATG